MSDFHQRLASRAAALLMAGGLVAGCSSPSPGKIDYRSDSRTKQVSLAVPPNMLDENPDQRSLPPAGGQTSLSALKEVQEAAPADDNSVLPPVPGMHIQRDGTESWLVIDSRTPGDVWAQVRRFWQEQGFLLVVDQRDKGVMETDWNETHPKINDGLIRNTLTWATGNSYVTAERNKYRTRLEAAPGGGTYVFISQKGLREALSGNNNDTSTWQPKPNDPALETEYLKRLMITLARAKPGVPDAQIAAEADAPASGAKAAGAPTAAPDTAAAATAAQNVIASAQPQRGNASSRDASGQYSHTELTLGEPYDRAWLRVGVALDRANFTVDDRDRTKGLYYVRYVDPRDMTSAEQGFWNQVFHGRKEKVAKQYLLNVRAVTESQTRVAIVDTKGNVDTSRPAQEIMALVVDQLH
ncbi:outer membrane protein assembly factor BamC [Paraburkholderia caballeronis]|uniref:Beta-barrel assembly machine subunit BamC n=1 Tax=Paraburkholderia caballeronis TaxID=416943 RepID=A0A1H7MS48_9BURK|nr:outer membrane protein assembly factor BamC [Paraburkholderia caballeronis]PXW26470.1 Beta-barrel assembly machine subunit BamC [Paraburkholderia caballeronis]PXX02017.1 Beta-barrel assembly machine subunit BamC [Paraburkholderia caballeronis]RAK01174.1 Beta-barrel assembly machine subunit BamC [Paraburkholderia caballeronis]TDV38335.1 Beta-barrel assembly machine subunit BamC [Paraburkholderia caballeronis]SEB93583.1 Beta-barrel assembly machine subunit BamC [Paraburkholderia caballeronis]